MRVKRSEASRTRMETYRQRARMATLMNNVATSTKGGRAVLTVQRNEEKQKEEVRKVSEEKELEALRKKLEEPPNYSMRDAVDVDLSNKATAITSALFGSSKNKHVLRNYTDEQLDGVLDVLLRDDNSEAVFHYTGEDLKRLLFRKLTTLEKDIESLARMVGSANGRIDAIQRYGNP